MERISTDNGERKGAASAGSEAPPFLRRFALPVAVGLNALLFVLTYSAFEPRFLWNDDPMMMLLAAGVGRTVEPTPELVTTHYFIGWALSRLYSFALNVPWYGLYIVAGLLAAHTAVLFLALRLRPTALSVAAYLLYFASAGVPLLLQLQFTITATWVSMSGLLLIGSVRRGETGGGTGVARNALGVALVVFGGMIRDKGVSLALAVLWPFLAARIYRATQGARARYVAWILAAIGLSFGASVLNEKRCARLPHSEELFERVDLAVQFLDYRALDRVGADEQRRILAEVEWSANDCAMFLSWFYMDESIYNVDSLGRMLSRLPSHNNLTLSGFGRHCADIAADPVVTACLLVLALGLVFLRARSLSALVVAVTAVDVLLLLAYMAYFLKPAPDRVYLQIFTYLALLPLLLSDTGRAVGLGTLSLRRKFAGVVLAGAVLVQAVGTLQTAADQSRKNAWQYEEFRAAIKKIDPRPDQLYLSWTGAVPWIMLDPFGPLDFLRGFVAPDTRPFPSTWKVLAKWGIEDVYRALVEDERVLLVVASWNAARRLPLLRRYMMQHYGVRVRFATLAANSGFRVLRVVPE